MPADTTQCLAADEPIFGLAEIQLNVAVGQTVTIVATLGTADTGGFTVVAGPPE